MRGVLNHNKDIQPEKARRLPRRGLLRLEERERLDELLEDERHAWLAKTVAVPIPASPSALTIRAYERSFSSSGHVAAVHAGLVMSPHTSSVDSPARRSTALRRNFLL